ncbi:MAG: hypothetical protein KJ648_04290 [Candidatus Omnitrophica bacterium]|nr:hypothetical protein [Candidatus Omnitrophota bacterium]MBU1767308.1 hypothetical protein [Candidatus Omnitrophota bacterium]
MVVVSLTIWGIDSLIRKRKDKKIKDINREKTYFITLSLNLLMYGILRKFNLISEQNGGKNHDFANAYEEFKKTANVEAILKVIHKKSISFDKQDFKFLKSFYKEISDRIGSIRKQIEDIKPYPKPEIIKKLSDITYLCIQGDVTIKIGTIIADTADTHKSSDFEAKFIKILQEHIYKDNFGTGIRDIFNKIISVRDSAFKNELYCDIY